MVEIDRFYGKDDISYVMEENDALFLFCILHRASSMAQPLLWVFTGRETLQSLPAQPWGLWRSAGSPGKVGFQRVSERPQRGPRSWGKGSWAWRAWLWVEEAPGQHFSLQEWGELGQESVMATRLIPVRNEVTNCMSLLSWPPHRLTKETPGCFSSASALVLEEV